MDEFYVSLQDRIRRLKPSEISDKLNYSHKNKSTNNSKCA